MDPEKEYQFKDIIGRDAKDFSEKVRFFNDQSMIRRFMIKYEIA